MTDKKRICSSCGKELPESAFSKDCRHPTRRLSQCIKCRNLHQKEMRDKLIANGISSPYRKRQWALATIRSHRKSGNKIIITTDQLTELAEETTHCKWCGRELQWETGKGVNSTCPTLDRRNNESFLDIDNVDIICLSCNAGKGKQSEEEFRRYIKKMYEVTFYGRQN